MSVEFLDNKRLATTGIAGSSVLVVFPSSYQVYIQYIYISIYRYT